MVCDTFLVNAVLALLNMNCDPILGFSLLHRLSVARLHHCRFAGLLGVNSSDRLSKEQAYMYIVFCAGLKRNPNGTSLEEVQVPFDMDQISDFIPGMASQWSAISYKLSLRTEVNQWISRQERNDEKCQIIINAAIDQQKLTS